MVTKRTHEGTENADDEPALKKQVRGEERRGKEPQQQSPTPSHSPSVEDEDRSSARGSADGDGIDASRQEEDERSPPVTKSHEKQENDGQDEDTDGEEERARSENEDEEDEKEEKETRGERKESSAAPVPDEEAPPLPDEPPPDEQQQQGEAEDDGWDAVWDSDSQAYYFYNRFTGHSQWENPRVPPSSSLPEKSTIQPQHAADTTATTKPRSIAGGYNPAIHGDYDPNAPYARVHEEEEDEHGGAANQHAFDPYVAVGAFNRFTGRWQAGDLNPDRFSQDNKGNRQIEAFFDAGAAANRHDGRSLKAERSARKLTKKEIRAFTQKKKERKEEKRRAWLRD